MASFVPYTFYQCPCSDNSIPTHRPGDKTPSTEEEAHIEDERTLDPRAPRANYSLYPLEHLFYCEDCHQMRCPRCVLDEIVTYYCPNCLFEVPSSTVKSEGNRCTRSCFQCPICISPLSVSSLEAPPEGLGADQAPQSGPFVLNCGYCTWSSKEIGIVFEKPQSIYAQLQRIQNGGQPMMTPKERRRDREERKRDVADSGEESPSFQPADPIERLDAEGQFSNLHEFYQSQLADSNPSSALGFSSDYGYGSPGALSRIMGLYTGGTYGDKKTKSKRGSMREAHDATEGLQITSHSTSDTAKLRKLRSGGWESTSSLAQLQEQFVGNPHFKSDLRPIPNLLRTKRSKRCKTCRHILSKPESKVQTTRFRIRLIALNYLPSITIKPLQPLLPTQSTLLTPLKPTQFLLTFKNPLFDTIKVTLATPTQTPGRFSSKITILCPQFEVGANTDMWDEALGSSKHSSLPNSHEKRRTKAEAEEGQGEAGKIWERGRNWTSIVVEVVPASLGGPAFLRGEAFAKQKQQEVVERERGLGEDEDVVEVPVAVRVEWESEGQEEAVPGAKKDEGTEKREAAYWCVLGIGRIAGD